MSVPFRVERAYEREMNQLDIELEMIDEADPDAEKRRAEIRKAKRELEREMADYEREYDRRDAFDSEHS